ncbi:hypothetical protein BJY01DRAFT_254164 [Aspergillus pseudoustus]|uniref:Uncharacterized protein n=1 Tax=Aspergillus pseudoustus TaxID=1810923 RepID=A0ABR4IVE0_9EURO
MHWQLANKSTEERLRIKTKVQGNATKFWRACGFRRIGASNCFAFSFDPHHQSRALASTSDFDPRRSYAKDIEDEETFDPNPSREVEELKIQRLRDSLPLHHAAVTLEDDELKTFFATHLNGNSVWDRVTTSEATLLHLTARELKPQSTRWLLENVENAEYWTSARDLNGFSPLEALQEKLETTRKQKKTKCQDLKHIRQLQEELVMGLLSSRP